MATQCTRPVRVRYALKSDRLAMLDIERTSLPHPWGDDLLTRELAGPNTIGAVAVGDDQVVGFVVYAFDRRSILIKSLAVASNRRHEGFGRALVGTIARKIAPRRPVAQIWVRETNLAAQQWLRRLGWIATHVDRRHFVDECEDGYLFQLTAALRDSAERRRHASL